MESWTENEPHVSLDRMNDVTKLLTAFDGGEPLEPEKLLPMVYTELRRLASARLANEKPGQTLQPTALVHEAYLRLVANDKNRTWKSKAHFFYSAAEAIRCILIDQARKKMGPKAGGKRTRVTYSELLSVDGGPDCDVFELNDALELLRNSDPRAAQIVNLRFFVGLTRQQCAALLGISLSTADKDWAYAKAWLQRRLSDPFEDLGVSGSDSSNSNGTESGRGSGDDG